MLSTTSPPTGLEQEDALSFTSAIFGALGSTLQQQNSPRTLLLGLIFAAFAKALPSLGQSLSDPNKKDDRMEDGILFFSALIALLGAGIQSNFTFNTPTSQAILVFGLVIGLAGKAIPSLLRSRYGKGTWSTRLEDLIPLAGAIASAIALYPWGVQYASVGIFFGFLGKQLAASQPPPTQPAAPVQRTPPEVATHT